MAKVIVVYGGGFQPFHAGHLSSYLEAKEAFPNADFYVAASNDTKTRPIPFNDKQFLAQQAGVSDPFVQVKAPINPKEILDRYSPKQDIFILVRSERDPVGYTKKDGSPGYYQPFVSLDKCEPFGYHGYVFVTHKKEFKLNGQVVYSGTQVRDMYANSDDKGRLNIIQQLYPRSSEQGSIKQMLDKYIGSSEPIVEPDKSAIKQLKAKKLKEQIQRMRPLIKEASIEQKYKMLKLIKEATQLDELDLFKKKKPEPVKVEPETSPNDYHSYFSKPEPKKEKVYRNPGEYVDATKIDPLTGKKVVDEFAPPGGDDNGPDEEEILFRLAKQWWLGTEQDMIRVERTLASMGWEIGEDEGSYDNGGVFVVRAGDEHGKSYQSWPHEELIDEGQTSDMRSFFSTQQPLNPAPIQPTMGSGGGPTIATVTRQSEGINEFSSGGNFQPPKPPKNKGNDPWGDDDDDDYSSRPRGPNIIGKQMLKLQQQKKRIIWRPWLYDGQPDIIAIIKNVKPTKYDPNLFEFTYSWKTSGGKWVKRNTFINPGSESIYSLIPYNDYTYELRQTEESINDSDDLNEVSQEVNEISDETLQSYLGKADRQVSNRLDRMSQARDRLNKNYEIYDVNNPAKIIDRFEADTPKLAKQYFDKFVQEYNPGDIDFHFDVRRSTGIIENRIIYAGSKVNLFLVYKQKPIKLNKEPIDYTDENLKKYAIVAYVHLRDTTGRKFSVQSIMRAIIVKPLEVHQTNTESIDYLEEK